MIFQNCLKFPSPNGSYNNFEISLQIMLLPILIVQGNWPTLSWGIAAVVSMVINFPRTFIHTRKLWKFLFYWYYIILKTRLLQSSLRSIFRAIIFWHFKPRSLSEIFTSSWQDNLFSWTTFAQLNLLIICQTSQSPPTRHVVFTWRLFSFWVDTFWYTL